MINPPSSTNSMSKRIAPLTPIDSMRVTSEDEEEVGEEDGSAGNRSDISE